MGGGVIRADAVTNHEFLNGASGPGFLARCGTEERKADTGVFPSTYMPSMRVP